MVSIDRVGQVFATCLRIENRIRDFILVGANPEFIPIINKTISEFPQDIANKLSELQKQSFSSSMIDQFIGYYSTVLSSNDIKGLEKIFYQVLSLRDVMGHGYFRINGDRIWHMPNSQSRRDFKIKHLKVQGENNDNPISSLLDDDYIGGVQKVFDELDQNMFPAICEMIGLNYGKIR